MARRRVPFSYAVVVLAVALGAVFVSVSSFSALSPFGIGGIGGIGAPAGALAGGSSRPAAAACSDSDSGVAVAVQGTCASGGSRKADACLDTLNLVEYSCARTGCVQQTVNCPLLGYSGCASGACVMNTTNQSCTDTDGGLDYYLQGTIFGSTPSGPYSYTDVCLPGNVLQEGFCQSPQSNGTFAFYLCPSGCQNGACANATAHLECVANTCQLVNGSGTNQCFPAGSACNATNASQPDLTVLSLTYVVNTTSNQTNSSNQSVFFTAAVKNIGNATASASFTHFLTTFPYPYYVADVPTPALAPGAQASLQTSFPKPPAGLYSATATADASFIVSESNELNNAFSINVTIT